MEELEQALVEYNMGDSRAIKDIIAEVDTDHVCLLTLGFTSSYFVCLLTLDVCII